VKSRNEEENTVPRALRLTLFVLVALAALPATTAVAAVRMPIGFFDDPSFRWSPARQQNLKDAAATGATVIHTTASWPSLAPTKPANPADGDDPAYHLADLDELVFQSSFYGLRVMIDITGTPKWANGGQAPNHMPRRLSDLTTFARMLATRYNGHHGHGMVGLWSVWNEPNLQLFLTPQFVGKKIVGPANYAKLYRAAYAGIKGGNPNAKVAIGETSARGRDRPLGGTSASIAPGTFARLLASQHLRFDAWAHHPYPTDPKQKPLQKVRYPNVSLALLPTFEADLKRWYHRSVPVWVTEYGHETKPGEPKGISTALQAAYARQALTVARKDPNIQMFIWFTFRDSGNNPWQSGLEVPSGAHKPAYSAFSGLARGIDGNTVTAKAGHAVKITTWVPYLAAYSTPGSQIGLTYSVYDGKRRIAIGQPSVPLKTDESISFTPAFTPAKGKTYTVVVVANEINGHTETRSVAVTTS
jgi:hypothetical protein